MRFLQSTVGTHGIQIVSSHGHLHQQRVTASLYEYTPELCLKCYGGDIPRTLAITGSMGRVAMSSCCSLAQNFPHTEYS